MRGGAHTSVALTHARIRRFAIAANLNVSLHLRSHISFTAHLDARPVPLSRRRNYIGGGGDDGLRLFYFCDCYFDRARSNSADLAVIREHDHLSSASRLFARPHRHRL